MSDTYTLRPAADRRARHPDGRVLDAAGETVARDPYWNRRIADVDVEIHDAETAPASRKGRA